MAFLGQAFSADQLPQGNGGNYDPLPPGWYTVNITQAELKSTAAGDGQYIKMRYDITGPTHEGRVVFGNLNIRNPNPKMPGADLVGMANGAGHHGAHGEGHDAHDSHNAQPPHCDEHAAPAAH